MRYRPRTNRRQAAPCCSVCLLAFAIVGLVSACLVPAEAAARQVNSVVWDRYDVSLDLRADGSFHVVERQVVDFRHRSFSTAFADIPLARIDGIGNVVVREERAGGIVAYNREDRFGELVLADTYRWEQAGGYLAVRWRFEPVSNARRTFLLEYDVYGALRVYLNPTPPAPPNQQIWWTAIGTEATEVAPVLAASMTVRLPRPVDLTQTVVAQDDAIVAPDAHTQDGQVWTWQAQDLSANEAFSVRLQFPPLVEVAPPAWQQRDDEQRQRAIVAEERRALVNVMFFGIGLLAVVGGGIGVYGLWYLRGRDPHVGLVTDFLPQPPDDLPPGAAGALVDEVVHQRDIVATLVDLARRGVVAMNEQVASFGADVELTLVTSAAPLVRFERELLASLFGYNPQPGTKVLLWSVSSKFGNAAPDIRAHLYQELVDRGYFAASPEATRYAWRNRALTAFLVLLLGGGLIGVLFLRRLGWYWFPLLVAALLAVVVYLLSGALPRKTATGAEAAATWRAFGRYLEGIERYENVDDARDIFDRYLPYAVAFGLEESWVGTFARAGADVPPWYAPTGWSDDPGRGERDRLLGRHRAATWSERPGRSWWDVTHDWGEDADRVDGGGGGGGRFNLPDWQGTSDHAGRALQSASNGMMSMFNAAGDALSAIAEASAKSSRSSSGGRSGRSSNRSFGGGGRRGGSSGGGRRGFG